MRSCKWVPGHVVLAAVTLAALPPFHPATAVSSRLGILPPLHPPSLLVVITIDQLRPDYLDRWADQWSDSGGFRRFRDRAVFFPHGMQDHGMTETAPGHSTILSGREPVHTGIVLNELGVGDPQAPLIGTSGPGASPRRFQGTTLVDWLRAAHPATRVLSVSKKDRAAILPVGRARAPVFWYAGGKFTSSTYYWDTLPVWVVAYNRRDWGAHLAGGIWGLLLPLSRYAEPDSEPFESGPDGMLFPHHFPANPAAAANELTDFPWMDSLTLDFALTGTKELGLGRGGSPDLLAVGLSATDYIGHDYGPDSREMHDHLLRLDRWLGVFLDSVAALVPGRRVLAVLTADHGVTPIPEHAARLGHPGGRIAIGALVRSANRSLRARTGEDSMLVASSGLIYADLDRLEQSGVNRDSLRNALARQLASLPGVRRVYTGDSLRIMPATDSGAARWKRTLPEQFPWLVSADAKPGYIWSDATRGTTHGSTNPDDVQVPIAFWGSGLQPRRVERPVRTVDIAPTLARMLGVKPLEAVDGVVLEEVTSH